MLVPGDPYPEHNRESSQPKSDKPPGVPMPPLLVDLYGAAA